MSILITIVDSPDPSSAADASKSFGEQGGTIGRGPDNSWVLADPERFMSSRHSQINYESGNYYLTDLSTNGTFFNNAPEAIGKGVRVKLADGDLFSIGDYRFQISLWNPFEQKSETDNPDQLNNVAGKSSHITQILSQQFNNNPLPLSNSVPNYQENPSLISNQFDSVDPLAVLDQANNSLSSNHYIGDNINSYSDESIAINQAFSMPGMSQPQGIIPDDWEDELNIQSEQATQNENITQEELPNIPNNDNSINNKSQVLEAYPDNASKSLEGQNTEELSNQSTYTQKSQHNVPSNQIKQPGLLRELGLNTSNLSDAEITEIQSLIGVMIRESIEGLMRILASRNNIKNEFRMSITTIQPVENNPLKFSVNVDDALENMFLKSGNAYKKPVEAIKEGFDSIAEHQLAVIAGIRHAFYSVIDRFDPDKLEQRFNKKGKTNILPMMQKARNWDVYCEYFSHLVNDMDNSFQYLFGDEFVKAYEEQLQKQVIQKKRNTI